MNLDDVNIIETATPAYDKKTPVKPAANSNNQLACDLYQTFARDAGRDNLFFSPASISAALMLAYEGAAGTTRNEFENVLSLEGTDRLNAHKAYAGMFGRLPAGKSGYELYVANALWGEQTMPFNEDFLDTLKTHYEASFASVDYKNDFETQRERINQWVANKTKDKITGLLAEGSLNADTRLVLANAIYFKGRWSSDFYEGATKAQPFYRLDGKTVQVPLMKLREERFKFTDLDGYDAISLGYDYDMSMLVLLPEEQDGLAALEQRLSADMIRATTEAMRYETVNLWLPRWETTRDYDVIPALKQLGMRDAFDEQAADFTRVSDSAAAERLYIATVAHKAFIAVDEEGTEAAAATAIAEGETAAAPDLERVFDFRADHPFIYMIRHNKTGAILFIGRVTDPS